MKAQNYNSHKILRYLSLILLGGIVAFPSIAMGQSSTITARTPGTPAGSYKLGEADTINLFTGNLNYNLPLLNIGGRGAAQTALGIVIEGQWDRKETDAGNGFLNHEWSFKYPDPLALVGTVQYEVNWSDTGQPCVSGMNWITYIVSMTYVEADGTRHSLRNRPHHGFPITVCGHGGTNLGNIFESTAGDFTTFVTDTNIWTDCWNVPGCTNAIDGHLFFRNGSKARVVGGYIQWLQDRNGNKLEYQYETNPHDLNAKRLIKIIDPLSREVTISYDVNEPEPVGRCTKLTFKGFGNQERVIRISRESDLMNLLRNTQPYDTTTPVDIEYNDPNDNIFLFGAGSMPDFIEAIWLPDGRKYQFRYNILGQLARVELPTGGAIEYDFADIFEIPFEPGPGDVGPATNRVSEKRVYDNNNVLLSKTVFTIPTSYTSGVIHPQRGGVVRDVEVFEPNGTRLSKSRHYFHGTPNGIYGWLVPWWHSKEFRVETFAVNGTTMLRVNENDWRQRTPSWCSSFPPCAFNPAELAPDTNPFILESKTTLVDGNLVSKESAVNPSDGSWAFDSFNNQTGAWHYDFGSGLPGPLVKHVQTSYINHLSGSIFLYSLVDTTSVYEVNSSGFETLASSSQTVYDEYVQYPLLTYGTVTGWQQPSAPRGNPTTVKRWLNTNGTWIETHAQFDQLGNVRKSYDELGRMSETTYNDAFTDSVNRNTFAFATQSTSPIPDPGNLHGSNVAFTSTAVYDYWSGLVKTSTDINGQTTTLEYNDPLDRLKKIINPTGGGSTSFDYGDTIGSLNLKTTTTLDATRNVESFTYFDGLGRAIRSFTFKATGGWVIADTQYDAANRVRRISKPYQGSSLTAPVNPDNNWVTTEYDALGRTVKVTTADGSQSVTSYNGNTVTFTDADLKKRSSVTDVLGRLIQVVEDPGGENLITNYKHDVLGNLRRVEQGAQRRYYMYDSLSRLIRSRNPEQEVNPDLTISDPVADNEQWSTSTEYFANGDISARTDARGIRIALLYDNLNRLFRRTYTQTRTLPTGTYTATPTIDHQYDGKGLPSVPQYSLGKLTRTSSSVSETRYTTFDAMGRITSSEQITDGQTYQMACAYNLAGDITSETYPSGRIVTTSYDNGGVLSGVTGQVPGQAVKTFASNFDYSFTATGATSRVQLGNGRWESTVLNKRLQPTLIGLGTTQGGTDLMKLEYNYGTTNNNGNLRTETITTPTVGTSPGFVATQTYGYDNLNRLTSAVETTNSQPTWQQTFDFDDFGNRSVVTNATTTALIGDNPTVSPTTNRITPQGGEQYQHDAAGNLLKDKLGNTYAFDGENAQTTFTGAVTAQYSYDADGHRVKKVVGSTTTVFVYNIHGQMVAEYSTATGGSGTTYLTNDKLGSPRVNTTQSGIVLARHDYHPYGEEIGSYGGRTNHAEYHSDSVRQKFTGYLRDDENGLDYAQARYYASKAGRFTSVDPLMASANNANPQTFNRYTYVLNNPYRYVDPTGMEQSEVDAAFAHLAALVEHADALRAEREEAEREAQKKQAEQQQQQPQQQKPPDSIGQRIEDQIGPPPPMPGVQIDEPVLRINANDTSIENFNLLLIDKVKLPYSGDIRVPIGGEFEITYSYFTSAPKDNRDPASLGRIEPINPKGGTITGNASPFTRVGEPVVIITPQKESVRVHKTERFRVERSPGQNYTGGGFVINYAIVVTSPTTGQTVRRTTVEESKLFSGKRIPKPVPVVNSPKK